MTLLRRAGTVAIAFVVAAASIAMPATAEAAALTGRLIRVGLGTTLTTVRLSADGAYNLVNQATGGIVVAGQAGQVAEVKVNATGLAVTGVGTFTGPLVLQPAAVSEGQPGIARWESKRYRGELEIRRNGAGQITLVNQLDLEDYLLGVVPREMPSSFPVEALKAQAVAARTYALYQTRFSKYESQGFDVVDTTDSQVYGGVNSEDSRATAAVRDTRDMVVLHDGTAINALFFASGGGYTENNENVYSSASVPYLRGVPDFDQDSPKYNWKVSYPLAQWQQLLTAKGYDVGTLYGIEPAGPRGVSGRWTTLALVGSKGRLEIKSSQLRFAVGLNSTLFEIVPHEEGPQAVQTPLAADQTIQVLGRDGARASVPAGGVAVRGAGSTNAAPGSAQTAMGRQMLPATLELVGHGWGHGVGLSQWGARGMANGGDTFDTILRHYYQGTTVGPRPELAGGS